MIAPSIKQLASRKGRLGWIFALLIVGLGQGYAGAHGLSSSYTTLTVSDTGVAVEVALSVADMIAHFGLDADNNQRVSREEVASALPTFLPALNQYLHIKLNGSIRPLSTAEATVMQPASGLELFVLHATLDSPGFLNEVTLSLSTAFFELLGQNHSHFVKVVSAQQTQQAILSLANPRHTFVFDQPLHPQTELAAFLYLGIKHIFLGYDHVLFLLALIIAGGGFWCIIKIVTAFTLAHTVTLILAALQIVSLPAQFVESAIALSIAYVALENLIKPTIDHRWLVAFAFGLVHGFGFANVLRELSLPTANRVGCLLSFNVGVEAGQAAIVALLYPAILAIARHPAQKTVSRAISLIILAFGLGWAVERLFGLSFMPF